MKIWCRIVPICQPGFADARRRLPLAPMNIAVNTRLLLNQLEGTGYFIREVFDILAKKHAEHQFYFLFDRPYDSRYVVAPNVHALVVPPPARHPLLWKLWFDVKVPLVLKKIKADVFVTADGLASLTTRVPQCLVVHDLAFLHHPEAYQKSHQRFYSHYTPRFLKKAASAATVSQFSRDDIIRRYKIDPQKISVVYNGVRDLFQPLSFEQKETIKQRYTGGHEYFVYAGAIQPRKNLLNLLRAFSVFKKRMQSSMKLVLAGRLAWKTEAFEKLIRTYKYRDDVVITGYLPEAELSGVIGSAYAMVYPSFFEGFGVPVLEAMKSGVPVLTSENSAMQEIGGEAALYFDAKDPAHIAELMMIIYRDEPLRTDLIAKGLMAAKEFTWQRTAELLWTEVMKAAAQSSQR